MAERYAVATGNWSSTSTWDGGTLPTSADDVYANNFTVTIDQNVTVLSLRTTAGTTAVAGGGFTTSGAYTIEASSGGIVVGSTSVLTVSTGSGTTTTVKANAITASTTTTNVNGVVFSGGGTLALACPILVGGASTGRTAVYMTGGGTLNASGYPSGNTDVRAGTNTTAYGVHVLTTGGGTVAITGSITHTSATAGTTALLVAVATTIAVSGNVAGGASTSTAAQNIALNATAVCTISVTGNVSGGTGNGYNQGIAAASGSLVTVSGNVTGGAGSGAAGQSAGIYSAGSLSVDVAGTATGGSGASGVAIYVTNALTGIGTDPVVLGAVTGGSNATAYGIYCGTGSNFKLGNQASPGNAVTGASANGVYIAGNVTLTTYGTIVRGTSTASINVASGATYTLNINGEITNAAGAGSSINIASTSGGTITVVGNVSGGSSANGNGITGNTGTTLNVTGNVTGGSNASAYGISVPGGATAVSVTGNVLGGSAGDGVRLSSSGATAITITGSVTGGSAGSASGLYVTQPTGTVAVIGDVIGGSGATGLITPGLQVASSTTGTVTVTGGVRASATQQAILGNATGDWQLEIDGVVENYNQIMAISSYRFRWKTGGQRRWKMYDFTSPTYVLRDMIALDNANYPTAGNVKTGITYGWPTSYTGTLTVVDNAAVAAAVWDYQRGSATTSGSMGERLKNAATVDSTGAQIAAFGG